MGFMFFVNSVLLGIGLAMDAFSVSLANGMGEPGMKSKKMIAIAGTFGFFQALMPMLGWVCVHTIIGYFKTLEKFIPWIALFLLTYIGGKMLLEGIKHNDDEEAKQRITPSALLLQGIATSIDALSVGFTIANYNAFSAAAAAFIIAAVTFIISMIGLVLGRSVGNRFSDKAEILGGIILIAIGLEIFFTS